MRQDARIEVIQAGLFYEVGDDFFHLKHEPTHETGLSHMKWTVSAARYDVGQNYPSFFICMRDEPSLDHGGARHPDGQGFAAFGTLIAGFDVVEKIYAQAESEEFLKKNIKIKSASFA